MSEGVIVYLKLMEVIAFACYCLACGDGGGDVMHERVLMCVV